MELRRFEGEREELEELLLELRELLLPERLRLPERLLSLSEPLLLPDEEALPDEDDEPEEEEDEELEDVDGDLRRFFLEDFAFAGAAAGASVGGAGGRSAHHGRISFGFFSCKPER